MAPNQPSLRRIAELELEVKQLRRKLGEKPDNGSEAAPEPSTTISEAAKETITNLTVQVTKLQQETASLAQQLSTAEGALTEARQKITASQQAPAVLHVDKAQVSWNLHESMLDLDIVPLSAVSPAPTPAPAPAAPAATATAATAAPTLASDSLRIEAAKAAARVVTLESRLTSLENELRSRDAELAARNAELTEKTELAAKSTKFRDEIIRLRGVATHYKERATASEAAISAAEAKAAEAAAAEAAAAARAADLASERDNAVENMIVAQNAVKGVEERVVATLYEVFKTQISDADARISATAQIIKDAIEPATHRIARSERAVAGCISQMSQLGAQAQAVRSAGERRAAEAEARERNVRTSAERAEQAFELTRIGLERQLVAARADAADAYRDLEKWTSASLARALESAEHAEGTEDSQIENLQLAVSELSRRLAAVAPSGGRTGASSSATKASSDAASNGQVEAMRLVLASVTADLARATDDNHILADQVLSLQTRYARLECDLSETLTALSMLRMSTDNDCEDGTNVFM